MRKAEPNWDLLRVPANFPYLRLLFYGIPPAASPARFPIPREHRAKLFAPFDALEGFSDSIRDRNSELVEAFERRNPC